MMMRTRVRQTSATFVATAISFLIIYALCQWAGARTGPALLAAVLALTLSRTPQHMDGTRTLVSIAALTATGLAAIGVGRLFETIPLFGAIAFTIGIFLSIWLRQFGERVRRVGSLLAQPLIVILIVPARADAPGGPLVDLALALSAAIVSLLTVSSVQAIARVRPSEAISLPDPPAQRAGSGWSVTTRMALQMALGLSLAFAVGFVFFPAHWGWVVLTAFLVASGTRGRGDVAYKAVLRFGGALVGTIGAAALAHLALPNGPIEAAIIFAVLFVALLLRERNYAYWAAGMTLILAVLSRGVGPFDLMLFLDRLAAIVVGAICAVGSAWFIVPIRTRDVIRRRLADALVALDDVLTHADHDARERADAVARYQQCIAAFDLVDAPVTWHRRITRSTAPDHPARWIEIARRLHAPSTSLSRAQAGRARRAIGVARRAVGAHGSNSGGENSATISDSLRELEELLNAEHGSNSP